MLSARRVVPTMNDERLIAKDYNLNAPYFYQTYSRLDCDGDYK